MLCCVVDVTELTKLKVLVKCYHRRERKKEGRREDGRFIRWYCIREIRMSPKILKALNSMIWCNSKPGLADIYIRRYRA